jgi:hypothetical protein
VALEIAVSRLDACLAVDVGCPQNDPRTFRCVQSLAHAALAGDIVLAGEDAVFDDTHYRRRDGSKVIGRRWSGQSLSV